MKGSENLVWLPAPPGGGGGRVLQRHWIIAWVLAVAVGAAVVARAQDLPSGQPNYYAVIIGISEFSELPQEEWLEYAVVHPYPMVLHSYGQIHAVMRDYHKGKVDR